MHIKKEQPCSACATLRFCRFPRKDAAMPSFYDFQATSIDGQTVPLSQYRGQVVLVVNTASACGFTPQLQGLQELHTRYARQGLVILGFPATSLASRTRAATAKLPASASATMVWSLQ